MKIELTNYGRKGINAYICPIDVYKGRIEREAFIKAVPIEGEEDDFYRGKSAKCTAEITADGLYEFKEANGHKTKFGYLLVKDGEIIQEWDSAKEMLRDELAKCLPPLPELEGSEKQVDWAIDIRLKVLCWLWCQGLHGTTGDLSEDIEKLPTEAKWWIDHQEFIRRDLIEFLGIDPQDLPTVY